jgi:hypothetical protein
MSMARAFLDTVYAAHGGSELWQRITAIEATISADGFLFTTKHARPLHRQRVVASTVAPTLTLHDYPAPGQCGEWIGDAEVLIRAADGSVLARRASPRLAFHGWRRSLWWDPLDFLYFAGYATWNYLVTPFLFQRPGFGFEPLAPRADGIVRLAVDFPPDIPSHCRHQIFHFDPQGHLLRFDYTAEPVGAWAHAAHGCTDYRDFGGLRVPTLRRVLPLFHRRDPLPFPTLVALEIHELIPHIAC